MDLQQYSIRYRDFDRMPHGNYEYEIFCNSRLIARYWHDYRGVEHGIEFMDGIRDEGPVGRIIDFVSGGGPEPLSLSKAAVEYLSRYIGKAK